jgi:hypothetical protein
MKYILTLMLLLMAACVETEKEETDLDTGENEEEDSLCPTPEEDECMTDELYAECQAELADCDGALIPIGDCPYEGWDCQ